MAHEDAEVRAHLDRAARYLEGVDSGDAIALAQLELARAQVAATQAVARKLDEVLTHLQRASSRGW